VRAGSARRILIALVACGVALTAHADYEDDYVAGLKALDQGRAADAQRYLQRAFERQSEPVDKIIVDGNAQPYLPLHFLGVAAARAGDCAAAEKYFGNPTNRRMLARLNALRQQEQQVIERCTPAQPIAATKTEAPKEVAKADAAPAKAGPPDALVQALQNYIGGRYLAATRIDPAALTEPRARFHAYVVRSAARFMLASTGLGDQGLFDAARADARAARAIDPRTPLDAATFPPRYRAFYDATR